MNKKGSLPDIIFLGIVLLFAGMIILLGFTVISKFNDEIQGNDIVTDDGKEAFTKLTGTYPGIIDNTFLFLAIGLAIGVIILAALVSVHPIFIPFYFIGLVIVTFLSGLFSNIYQEMAANSNLAAYAAQLTFVDSILTYLPLMVAVIGILLMLVMYKLNKQDEF